MYLVIDVWSPEPRNSSIIRIRGKDWRSRGPSLVYIFNYDQRFTDGFAVVNQNWDFAIHRVGLKKQIAFGIHCFFEVFVFEAFNVKSDLDPQHVRAWPSAQKLQVGLCHWNLSPELFQKAYVMIFVGRTVPSEVNLPWVPIRCDIKKAFAIWNARPCCSRYSVVCVCVCGR